MARFDQVIVNTTASTVEVGAGLIWDDVYQALDGTGLNVVGGRVSGVGVAGFTLGGGEWSYGTTVFWLINRCKKKVIPGRRASMGLRLIISSRTSSCFQTERFRLSRPKMRISGLLSG